MPILKGFQLRIINKTLGTSLMVKYSSFLITQMTSITSRKLKIALSENFLSVLFAVYIRKKTTTLGKELQNHLMYIGTTLVLPLVIGAGENSTHSLQHNLSFCFAF